MEELFISAAAGLIIVVLTSAVPLIIFNLMMNTWTGEDKQKQYRRD